MLGRSTQEVAQVGANPGVPGVLQAHLKRTCEIAERLSRIRGALGGNGRPENAEKSPCPPGVMGTLVQLDGVISAVEGEVREIEQIMGLT